MSSVSKFDASIQQARFVNSPGGTKVTAGEAKAAVANLTSDGKVTKAEKTAAKDAMESSGITKGAKAALASVVDAGAAPAGNGDLNAARKEAILSQVGKLERSAKGIQWKSAAEGLPVGPRMHSETLRPAAHRDSPSLEVMLPVGALAPGAKVADPNTVDTFYLRRTGFVPGGSQVAGPFHLETHAPSKGGLAAQVDAQAAPKALTRANKTRFTAILNTALEGGHVNWKSGPSALPVGARFARTVLMSEGHPDGFTYTALVPAGAIGPNRGKGVDPNKAESFFVERSGGFAGMTQFAGPFSTKAVAKPEEPATPSTSGIPAALQKSILKAFNKAEKAGSLHFTAFTPNSLPVGPRYVRETLRKENHPDGMTVTALIPAGGLRPGSAPDFSNVKSVFIETSGGIAGRVTIAGPLKIG